MSSQKLLLLSPRNWNWMILCSSTASLLLPPPPSPRSLPLITKTSLHLHPALRPKVANCHKRLYAKQINHYIKPKSVILANCRTTTTTKTTTTTTTTINKNMLSSLRASRPITTTARNLSSDVQISDGSFGQGVGSSSSVGCGCSGSGDKSPSIRSRSSRADEFQRAIQDLNLLQSNTQVLALAKYKAPEAILPLFRRQLALAGLNVNDLNSLNIIHVSGTKGKGSTCAFAESVLRSAGLKTGFYNSPHLVKVTERIRINGQPIDEKLFSEYFRQIFDRLVEGTRRENITMPSYFSFLTILAFHIFLEQKVDCCLIEVGIGGEYDPTNVIQQPVACAITTLDLDHTKILGNTIESIAWTKAGIMKPGARIYTIEHEQLEAMRVIETRARERGSPLYICKPIAVGELAMSGFHLGIESQAQFTNASLACQLAQHLLEKVFPHKLGPITIRNDDHNSQGRPVLSTNLTKLPKFFLDGLRTCQWPGRCQLVTYPRCAFFIDGAHTKKSMENCLEWFASASSELDSNAQRILMVNVIGERDKREVLRPLTKYDGFSHVIFSTNRINAAGDTPKSETFVNIQGPSSEKSLENVKSNVSIWEELIESSSADCANKQSRQVVIKDNVMNGLKFVYDLLNQHEQNGKKVHILATGSLHFVGAVLETLQSIDGTKL